MKKYYPSHVVIEKQPYKGGREDGRKVYESVPLHYLQPPECWVHSRRGERRDQCYSKHKGIKAQGEHEVCIVKAEAA